MHSRVMKAFLAHQNQEDREVALLAGSYWLIQALAHTAGPATSAVTRPSQCPQNGTEISHARQHCARELLLCKRHAYPGAVVWDIRQKGWVCIIL